jgi:ADP-ribosylglycohydrolase
LRNDCAIAGDVFGSIYEHRPIKITDFQLFSSRSKLTDDTVLTVAVAHAILDGVDYGEMLRRYARAYPDAGYSGSFYRWMHSHEAGPYGSWGMVQRCA